MAYIATQAPRSWKASYLGTRCRHLPEGTRQCRGCGDQVDAVPLGQRGEQPHRGGYRADLGQRDELERAIAAAGKRFGGLDVIVNNAGYANVSPIETTADEDFRVQFETNFWGVYNVSKAAIPVLRDQGGGGRVGGSPGIASYQAAKFAIDGFGRSADFSEPYPAEFPPDAAE